MPGSDAGAENEEHPDIIPSILNGSPFKIRPDSEKLEILRKGRPLPKLTIVKRDITKNCNRTFQSSWYGIHKWLCGSQNYNKLFCWPCVLMRPETSSWCSTGNDDMKRFTSIATKHALCKSHLKAISEYDETMISFSLSPEFVNETNVKCKEEDQVSDQTEDSLFDSFFEDETPTKLNLEGTPNNPEKPKINENSAKKLSAGTPGKGVGGKITFKIWKEMSKEIFPISKSKYLENSKMFKWKKKIARQELKNARLTGEKLKLEMDVLKAKIEYYKSLKDEVHNEPTSPSSAMLIDTDAEESNKMQQ